MLRPGQCLMVAVLEQAVADLESRSFNIRRKARAWFLARSARATHLFAFSRICQEFGCDPTVLRARILASVACPSSRLHRPVDPRPFGRDDCGAVSGVAARSEMDAVGGKRASETVQMGFLVGTGSQMAQEVAPKYRGQARRRVAGAAQVDALPGPSIFPVRQKWASIIPRRLIRA